MQPAITNVTSNVGSTNVDFTKRICVARKFAWKSKAKIQEISFDGYIGSFCLTG
ncbi:hypothetical protein SAMN05421681_101672 [Lysobacter enzymogenes]|nr:hypothetical protein SAMN05421681_101672 [Lysobacter enzymogenes]